MELKGHKGDDRVIAAGIISTIKKIVTSSGESMLFVKVEDATNMVEFLIFPRLLKETASLWQEGQAIIVDGKISEKDAEIKLLVNRARALNILEPQKSVDDFKRMVLEGGPAKSGYRNGNGYDYSRKNKEADTSAPVKPAALNPLRIIFLQEIAADDLARLRQIFAHYPGNDEVYFRLTVNGKANIIKTAFKVINNLELQKKIEAEFPTVLKIAQWRSVRYGKNCLISKFLL